MDRTKLTGKAWRALLLALALAMAGSAWALFAGPGCGSCDFVGQVFGGKNLAAVGVLYYAVLLIAALTAGPSRFLYGGSLVAAGVHAGLVAILLYLGVFCAPCVLTAVAALGALLSSIACDPSNAFRASLISPLAAGVVQLVALLSGALPAAAESRAEADRIVQRELISPPAPSGSVRMVVYSRPDCGYCIELEREVLPVLGREYGSRLVVERRSAEELPGIPTPTLILTGADRRRMFPGLPRTEDLREAIENLMGGGYGRQTVLEKSR